LVALVGLSLAAIAWGVGELAMASRDAPRGGRR
jgi:hypothetical protein